MITLRVLVFILCKCCLYNCFNFDTSHPIVYSDPHRRMRIVTSKPSYFGYSTILYSGGNQTDPWIQIGAPRGVDPGLPVMNPGVVFRCSIRKKCEMLRIETETGNMDYNSVEYEDKKDEAWIGSNMDIDEQSNMIVVCGYRWSAYFRRKQNFMQGACYWSRINESKQHKLLPLAEPENLIYSLGKNSYYFYAMGQSGFSAQLTHTKDGPELLLGAPGVLNWEGTTLVYKNLSEASRTANVPKVKYTEGALYGYAVTSGYFFNKDKLVYVGSSPKKSKYLGEILVYNFHNSSHENVDIIDSKQGSQMGEGFGYALASGDVNGDGYSDLVVGAPFYKSRKYNEGRVYIFYGSSKKSLMVLDNSKVITGKMAGGQFGTTIAYLGQFDLDGFGDIAVAAPYESDRSGTIYIYRGDANGLITEPSQVITGNTIIPKLKGFGITFSKLTDIDNNGYNDLAVGAYLSGHAVVIRAKPIVTLHQSVNVWNKQFDFKDTEIELCLWYNGYRVPAFLTVNRTIFMDRNLGRVTLKNFNDIMKMELLTVNQRSCRNYTISVKPQENYNIEKPINIRVSQQLAEHIENIDPFLVDNSTHDSFCKTCPVMSPYTPLDVDVPFALDCGDDNICKSYLILDVLFKGLESGAYIIGSVGDVMMNIGVSNTGELAYTTETTVELPTNVYLSFTPKFCSERNSSQVIVCKVENPLRHNAMKSLPLTLNMAGLMSQQSLKEMAFTVSVTTSSENLNPVQSKTFLLPLVSEADILLTGKSNQPSYSYGDINTGSSIFSQVYQIQKIGKSTIEEVVLHIHIPISITSSKGTTKFLKLYSHVGSLSGQPFICRNLSYVEYVDELTENDTPPGDDAEDEDAILIIPPPVTIIPNRRRRQVESVTQSIIYSNNLNGHQNKSGDGGPAEIQEALETPLSGYVIDCNTVGMTCVTISCTAGPFRNERHVGVVQVKALLDVAALKPKRGEKDKIVLTTTGIIMTSDFNQTGDLPDSATVSTLFLGDLVAKPVETWIIILAILIGLLLLLFVVMGLIKAGFFNRKKKHALQALRKAEDVENQLVPSKICLLDFQLMRYGSPAYDLTYFIFTCTDKKLRDQHYEDMLHIYHKSLCDFLVEFSCDGNKLFPYSALREQIKRFSKFGFMMSISVLHLMMSEGDEVPDMNNMKDSDSFKEFHFKSKNEDDYLQKACDIVLDFLGKGYM